MINAVFEENLNPQQRRLQLSEALRNKGIICQTFFSRGACPRGNLCPYAHIHQGETREVPRDVCSFHQRGGCLRETCQYFHGSAADLAAIRAAGNTRYMLQNHMRIADPPPQYLNPDGTLNIAAPLPKRPQSQAPSAACSVTELPQFIKVPSQGASPGASISSATQSQPQPVVLPRGLSFMYVQAAPMERQPQPQPQQPPVGTLYFVQQPPGYPLPPQHQQQQHQPNAAPQVIYTSNMASVPQPFPVGGHDSFSFPQPIYQQVQPQPQAFYYQYQ